MNGRLIRREKLTVRHRREMQGLLAQHFHGINEFTFNRDLAEKNWVVLIEDETGRLCGFTTLLYYRSNAMGRRFGVVCSGDTIVDAKARGTRALLTTWLRSVLWLGRDVEPENLYWLLISSGYRTFHFLPLFFEQYFPRHGEATPPQTKMLMDALAQQRWGDQYDREQGVVRFRHPQVLRPDVSPITERHMQRRHVAFFVDRNPGHADGDELVCLTSLNPVNLTTAGQRVLPSDATPGQPRLEGLA